jgi:hypothetical protein
MLTPSNEKEEYCFNSGNTGPILKKNLDSRNWIGDYKKLVVMDLSVIAINI